MVYDFTGRVFEEARKGWWILYFHKPLKNQKKTPGETPGGSPRRLRRLLLENTWGT
jgi:hypothetical protein